MSRWERGRYVGTEIPLQKPGKEKDNSCVCEKLWYNLRLDKIIVWIPKQAMEYPNVWREIWEHQKRRI